jgi:hypothetical protein
MCDRRKLIYLVQQRQNWVATNRSYWSSAHASTYRFQDAKQHTKQWFWARAEDLAMADGESYKHFDHERKSLTHPRTARISRRRERERDRRTIPDSSCTRTTPPQTTTTTTRSLVPGLLPAQTRPRSTTKPHLLVLLFLLVLFLRRLSTDRSKDQSFLESRARSHTHAKTKKHATERKQRRRKVL